MHVPEETIRQVIIDCYVKKLGQTADGKPIDILRELAKHSLARNLWSIARSTRCPLFEGPVSSWNELQIRLTYWLGFYANVEGAYDRPPARIIKNDELLNKWIERKAKEAEEKSELDWRRGSAQINKSAYDQDEVYEL